VGSSSLLDAATRIARDIPTVDLEAQATAPGHRSRPPLQIGGSLQQAQADREGRHAIAFVSLLTLFALAIQGFHPYAEDGGLYVAGIKKMLDPALFRVQPEFVLAHLRFSPFAATVAGAARIARLPLPWMLLAVYCGSVWATLYAGWMVISRSAESLAARRGAVVLLACWLTIPIAGTSLLLLDPYVTARSLSTPLTLFAIAWAMDATSGSRRGGLLCGLALTLAVVHPLMAAYALATIAVLLVVSSKHRWVRTWGPLLLCGLALATAAAVQALAPPESAQYIAAAMTRFYWFPLEWRWYELCGLAAPLALLIALGLQSGRPRSSILARTALVLGIASWSVALAFSRTGLSTHLVARMQPLRCFQAVYEVMILLLGAWLGEHWLGRHRWRWALTMAALGGVMFAAQRATYPASGHFEWPGIAPRNPWSQAFLWIRGNTPKDALFALDSHYITRPGEDAQGFRGSAERSILPDYSKDGGEASITPALAAAWTAGQAPQNALDAESDAIREAKLKPLGVSWAVLDRNTATAWTCPYQNAAVKVCRLP